jgi:hypothetical protein
MFGQVFLRVNGIELLRCFRISPTRAKRRDPPLAVFPPNGRRVTLYERMSWIPSRLGLVVAALLSQSALAACASQQQTGQALTAAGTAAVIVGAASSAGSTCAVMGEAPHGPVEHAACHGGVGSKAGKALAVAGAAVAAAGYALEHAADGPDSLPVRVASQKPDEPVEVVPSAPEPSAERKPDDPDGPRRRCASLVCLPATSAR